MASVTLEFLSPTDPDIVAFHLYESNSPVGSFTEVERTTAVGTYPNYIKTFTSSLAAVATDWFSIAWENAGGTISPLSQPVQGGTSSLVGIVTDRVMQRNVSLDKNVVEQEAEFVIGDYYQANPFAILPATVGYRTMRGLITLTLARAYMSMLFTSAQTNKWAAGLVSMDSSVGSLVNAEKMFDRLVRLANNDLDRNYSAVLLVEEITVAGGFKSLKTFSQQISGIDITRGIVDISID